MRLEGVIIKPVDKAAWATYHQTLRIVTTQAGFPNTVVWPTHSE
jgi:hypothetical protein